MSLNPAKINVNGTILGSEMPVLPANNRGYRYGDGLFETMVFINQTLFHDSYHFDRLWKGMKILQFTIPTHWSKDFFRQEIRNLASLNKLDRARVRLSVSRGNGDFSNLNTEAAFQLEVSALPKNALQFNEEGLKIDIYNDARKSSDQLSQLKTASCLPYVMASLYARQNNLSDALLRNANDMVCDSTIANLFVVHENQIITPPLADGPIAGVTRQLILDHASDWNIHIKEDHINLDMLLNAQEIFLTNVLYPVRWVRSFRSRAYENVISRSLYEQLAEHFPSWLVQK